METSKSGNSVPEPKAQAGSERREAAESCDDVEVVHATVTLRTAIRLALGLFIAYFAVQFARSIPETATRVLLGLVFAFAFDPIVTRLQKRLHVTRGIAVTVVGVLALLLFSVLVAVVGPSAVREAANSSRDLPETVDKLTALPVVGAVLDRLDAPQRIREWVADAPSQLSDQSISDFVEAVIGGMATGGTVIVVGVAVLLDGEALVRRLRQLVPRARRQQADLVGRLFQRTIGAYFAGSLLVASLAATFVLIVGLSLNVPLTPIAALWVLIVGFIPQIGGFLAASVFTVLALGRGPGTALLCLLLYWAYMTFENHVIQPAIVGNAVNLSAPATMLAALIGGSAMGVPGAILATPVAATAKALFLELQQPGSTEQAKRPSALSKLWHRIKKD